jgi:hypothetical protein
VVVAFERIKISYNWSDLFKGQLGLQLVTGITIEKPEVWLEYRGGNVNVEDLIKSKTEEKEKFGGSVSANGVIYPDSQKYNLRILGSGLQSSQLTTKDVSGPLSFSGTAVGDSELAVTQGSFNINNGKAYGLSFQTLTGNFVKRGSAETEISNITIKTALGTFYPEQLNQDIMNGLNKAIAERNIPTSMDEIKKVGTEKLIEHFFR